jgi:hypothetical protein
MNKSRETGFHILRDTGCKVGNHTFTWSGVWTHPEPPQNLRCNCGLYSYTEWLEQAEQPLNEAIDLKVGEP